jgi:protein NrfC
MSDHDDDGQGREIDRRDFLMVAGAFSTAAAMGGAALADDGTAELPVSRGYILVDVAKCQGCVTCMLACSLVHHGGENISLSRIQIMQDPYGKWPEDIRIEQCRQCVDPGCVKACPIKAARVDEDRGNVRTVNAKRCKRFRECIDQCNFEPSRMVWNFEDRHAQKCDLCADTPFWDREGGPAGRQACVELCPMKAIAFAAEVPEQEGGRGYYVDLRGKAWKKLGFPAD